jgi:transcriptional regulator GlxA family with amidase domain
MSARPEDAMSSFTQRTVAVTAYDHMNLLDLTGPLQALATANRIVDPAQRYQVQVVSAEGGPITTGCGLQVVTASFASLDEQRIET